MFERFTYDARRAVILAQEQARLLHDEEITVEHLMRGVVETDPAAVVLADGVAIAHCPSRGLGPGSPAGHIAFAPDAKRALELSLRAALGEGSREIDATHVAQGCVRVLGPDSPLLAKFGWEPHQARWHRPPPVADTEADEGWEDVVVDAVVGLVRASIHANRNKDTLIDRLRRALDDIAEAG